MLHAHHRSHWMWLGLSILSLVAACGKGEAPIPVSLHADAEAVSERGDDGPRLRVGIGCILSPTATLDLYGQLVDELGAQLDRPATTVQRSTYREMNDLLERGQVDCALVCTGAYLDGMRKFGMEPLVVPVVDGMPVYHSIIIVREDSGLREFQDLRGKRFALVDPLSNTGRNYPVWRVLQLGFTPDEFFETVYTHGHDKSIRAVRRRIVDGAAVDELVYEHLRASDPEQIAGLTIIDRSDAFGAPPVAVHPEATDETRAALLKAFLALERSAEGRRILRELRIDRFAVPEDDLYESAASQLDVVRRYDKGRSPR